MLKLSNARKRKNLASHQITQLAPVDRSDLKVIVVGLLFIWMDIFCIVGILTLPYLPVLDELFFIPLLVMNGWGIRLLVKNSYEVQMEFLYFGAMLGMLAMYGSFLWMMTFIHVKLEVSLLTAFIGSTLYFGGWIVYFTQYIFRKYATKHWKSKRNFFPEALIIAICIFPGLGYNNINRVLSGHPQEYEWLTYFGALISIFFIYIAVLLTHKLLYIRANADLFSLKEPTAKEKKRMKAKGIKLTIK